MARFKTLVLVSGLGISVCAAWIQALAAAPGINFYPARPWTAGAGGEICSIGNEFNNGFTLRFEGRNRRAETLNIDFIQNALKAGEDYSVNLGVPGVWSGNLPGHALSSNLLTVALPDGDGFYKALRDSSVLDINLAGNNFRFYLSGFASAAGGFESCLNAAAAAPVTPDVPADMPLPAEPAAASPAPAETPAWDPEGLLGDKKADAAQETITFEDDRRFGAAEEIKTEIPAAGPAPESVPGPVIPKQEMKVHREKVEFTADFTQDNNAPDANPPPFSTPAPAPMSPEAGPGTVAADETSGLEDVVARLEQTGEDRESAIAQNGNQEQATLRYKEAERQIQRLGEQIQRQRAQCNMEKKELEGMLFDPQVTSQQQLARLNDLEQKLAAAQAQIRALQNQPRTQ